MRLSIPESLSNSFEMVAKAAGKAGIVALRAGAVIGGVVIAGAGMYALTQTFMHHATDAAAYAFPLVSIPFGTGLATVGAAPKKALDFMDKII